MDAPLLFKGNFCYLIQTIYKSKYCKKEAKTIFFNRRRYESQYFEKYNFFIKFFINLFL